MSKLALQSIEHNNKSCSPFPDLGNSGLTELPKAIGEPIWLELLSFARECPRNETGLTSKLRKIDRPQNILKRLESGITGLNSFIEKSKNTNPFAALINSKALRINGTQLWHRE